MDFHTNTRRRTSHDYRGSVSKDVALSDTEQDAECNAPLDSDSESDESFFHWDQEATLLSDLMEEGPQQNEDQHLDALIDSLQPAFTDQGKLLKKEIVKTLVPTHNHVVNVFRVLEKNVDAYYGQGISLFNKACKDIEGTAYAQQSDLHEAYEATRARVEKLLEELGEEYAARGELWIKFNESVDKIVTPVIATVKDTPAKIERTIVKLDKHATALQTEPKDMSSMKKGLQDLLRVT